MAAVIQHLATQFLKPKFAEMDAQFDQFADVLHTMRQQTTPVANWSHPAALWARSSTCGRITSQSGRDALHQEKETAPSTKRRRLHYDR